MPRKKKAPESEQPWWKEKLDPTPVEAPFGYDHPPTLQDQIKMLVKNEMSIAAEQEGYETWEEADDFEMDDYPDGEAPEFLSKYEFDEMAPDTFFDEEEMRREAARKSETPDDATSAPAGDGTSEPITDVSTPE